MRLTIARKLALGTAAVLLLMVLSSSIAYYKIAEMNQNLAKVMNHAFPAVSACNELLNGLNHSVASLRGYIILGSDPRQAELFKSERRRAWESIDTAVDKLSELYQQSEGETRRHLTAVISNLSELRASQQEIEALEGEDLGLASSILQSRSAPQAMAVRTAAEALRDSAGAQMAEDRRRLDAASNAVVNTLVFATLLAIVLGAVISALLSRKIVSAVQQLVFAVDAVTAGDLTGQPVSASTSDEIGQLTVGFNKMVRSLRSLLAEAATMSNEAATASHQIAASSQQQVASLNQTATSLNQIATTVEEFKTTMVEFSDRARAVQAAADETTKLSSGGRALSQNSASRIEQVRTNSLSAGRSVLSLSEQMQRIGEITATVNEIAEQTKLLALNASIEAARAGDDGRGFAVVATQVRELANQSKQSAVRIESLISDTQRSMQDVASKIEEGSGLSSGATDIVRQVMQSFEEIARAVEQTRDAMVQINTAAGEQESGISELAASITEIDCGSKESLAAAEQTQQSIVAIDLRIRALNEAVARFKT